MPQTSEEEILAKRGEIDALRLAGLQTAGRIHLWRSDMEFDAARAHARMIAKSTPAVTPPQGNPPPAVKPSEGATAEWNGEKLDELRASLGNMKFQAAINQLRGAKVEKSAEEKREVLREICQEAYAFQKDIVRDVTSNPELVTELKSNAGQVAKFKGFDAKGEPQLQFSGHEEESKWATILADSWIEVHQKIMRTIQDENERSIRNSRAISFLWLAGDKEKAMNAAKAHGAKDAVFKSKWDRWMESMKTAN